ncbi:MAG TPA: type II secretion system protein [Candidatus Sumerlaeota bacterium]|nr:type II secretion system protein [Candidatus Sumerlaeota bacterium]HON49485.1 type II secretion system protein [Candidatus Sumerlaeota bacterium]HOR64634.1 type II secretion system protein [Candidatus Sumerlaeota bacterium]HPL74352.1 type II secretion system protein [Candidatus Sumerlaeota bacterium]HRU54866.1 type II secretion system protein [Candidatus Sumerlaeia bacterium]
MIKKRHIRAFTFAEILAAMLFMAIVIPVTVRGISFANRLGVLAERKRTAQVLAEKKLNELILDESWREGNQSGEFADSTEEADARSQYTWTLETSPWTDDDMRLVIVNVFYKVQETEHSASVATLAVE